VQQAREAAGKASAAESAPSKDGIEKRARAVLEANVEKK
jgi:hypothetical protein